MKGIIVYKTAGGSTETYARWIAEETGFECVPASKAGKLEAYDTVVIGANVRMYKASLGSWITKRWPKLKDKKTVLFTVASAPKDNVQRKEFVEKAVGPEIAGSLPHFPLDGRMVFADLPPFDRWLMNLAIKMTAKSDPAQAAEMAREYDGVKREDLAPLLAFLKRP